MWIYINKPDQVIWLAEILKWAWHLNLFSRTRVKCTFGLPLVVSHKDSVNCICEANWRMQSALGTNLSNKKSRTEPSGHTTLKQRWFNVLTLNQHWIHLVSMLCACWEDAEPKQDRDCIAREDYHSKARYSNMQQNCCKHIWALKSLKFNLQGSEVSENLWIPDQVDKHIQSNLVISNSLISNYRFSKWKSGPYFNMKIWQQVTK